MPVRHTQFLDERGNLGRQTVKEFQNYATPDNGQNFTGLYNVQCLYAQLMDNDTDEHSRSELGSALKKVAEVSRLSSTEEDQKRDASATFVSPITEGDVLAQSSGRKFVMILANPLKEADLVSSYRPTSDHSTRNSSDQGNGHIN